MAPRGGGDDAEQEIWRGTYSGKDMADAFMIGGLVTVVILAAMAWVQFGTDWAEGREGLAWGVVAGIFALVWLFLIGRMMVRKWSVSYLLTNQRFVHRKGLLKRTTDRIEVMPPSMS